MFKNMTEDKLKRMVTAITVAGTLIVVLLLSVIIYQFVSMGTKSAQINNMEAQIQEYEDQIADLDEQLTVYQSDKKKEDLARQNGYVYPDDKTAEDAS